MWCLCIAIILQAAIIDPEARTYFPNILRAMNAKLKQIIRRWLQSGGLIIESCCSGRREASLTFDDGPTLNYTQEILRCLDRRGVNATFFMTGENVEKNPEQLKRIIEGGHDIGNHTMSHDRRSGRSYSKMAMEYDRCSSVLRKATASMGISDASFIRPPYGDISINLLLYAIIRNAKVVLWTKDPEDFKRMAPERLDQYFSEHPPVDGDIVLLHDKPGMEISGVDRIIDIYQKSGLRLVSLSSLVSGRKA